MNTTTTEPSSNMCPFLTIPPEIRQEIYSYIVPQKETLTIIRPRIFTWIQEPLSHPILLVNKAISQEAASTIYGQNIITMDLHAGRLADKLNDLRLTLHGIGKLNCSFIRTLHLRIPFLDYLETVTKLLTVVREDCPGVRQVMFQVSKWNWPAGTKLYPSTMQMSVGGSKGAAGVMVSGSGEDCGVLVETYQETEIVWSDTMTMVKG